MRAMIDAHEAEAKASGARIVFSCGFDSFPFDFGVAYLQAAAKQRFGAPCARVKGRVRKMKGDFLGRHRGEFSRDDGGGGEGSDVMILLRDPFALTPGFSGPKQPSGMQAGISTSNRRLGRAVHHGPDQHASNVHRSNFLTRHRPMAPISSMTR